MAKSLSGLFGKLKSKQTYRPLKELLESKNVTYPLLVTVKSADITQHYGEKEKAADVFLFVEQKIRLKYARLQVVELPGQEMDAGMIVFLSIYVNS